jgi:hypothetical protein
LSGSCSCRPSDLCVALIRRLFGKGSDKARTVIEKRVRQWLAKRQATLGIAAIPPLRAIAKEGKGHSTQKPAKSQEQPSSSKPQPAVACRPSATKPRSGERAVKPQPKQSAPAEASSAPQQVLPVRLGRSGRVSQQIKRFCPLEEAQKPPFKTGRFAEKSEVCADGGLWMNLDSCDEAASDDADDFAAGPSPTSDPGDPSPTWPLERKKGPQKTCPQCQVKCACKRYRCTECGESALTRTMLSPHGRWPTSPPVAYAK